MPDSPAPPKMEGFLKAVDSDALKVVRRLLNAGHEAYLVGGCVRDIYLGRKPKDFDVATSATPEAIRKLFRNSRIIGRRFKLAHVFFGPKIIETSTFRTAPRSDSADPLITADNEWGSVEDDARRRDFTINGLFFDVDTQRIVDFVDGMDDLDGNTIRTIGEPLVRFREDPVRMIRAIKFAARLDFDFDPATWDALLEAASDIEKCSRARLLEEVYKLLRSGASRRSFELLLETKLLGAMMPSYVSLFGEDVAGGQAALEEGLAAFRSGEPDPEPEASAPEDADPDAPEPDPLASQKPAGTLLWRYLEALDECTKQANQEGVNGVLQAVLFAPLLSGELTGANRQQLDHRIEDLMTPVGTALGIARRDRELARQILMAHRRMVEPARRRKRQSLTSRQYFHDALIFLGISVQATGDGRGELSRWRTMASAGIAPHTPSTSSAPAKRRRRGGRRRKKSGSSRNSPASKG